jgi:hypothetical protein
MRLLLFLLFCTPILSYGQTSSVTVTIKEKYDHLNRNAWEDAWIYNADTSYKQYSNIHKRKAHFDSLPPDSYTVTIYSKYGNKEHKRDIEIKANTNNELEFDNRPEHFNTYTDTIPLLTSIKLGDTLNISWEMSGCFSFDAGWADIYKQGNNYFIRFPHKDSIEQRELNSKLISEITQAELHTLMNHPDFIISTNRYNYTFHLNNEVYSFRNDAFTLQDSLEREYGLD